MAVSIIEVATLAGVSKTTVSAVINGHSNVKPSTRKRVLEAIAQLDYHPNLAARELSTATKTNIGIILPMYKNIVTKPNEFYFPFINETSNFGFISRLIELISQTSYGLLIEHVVINDREPELPAFVTSERVAGVFQISPLFDKQFVEKLKRRVHCVVDIGALNPMCDSVYSNFVNTCKASVDYMYHHGHRRIAFINGDPNSRTYSSRLTGYQEGLAAHGLNYDASIVRAVPFTGAAGYQAFAEIYENSAHKPTAVICSTEVVSGGAMRYMFEKGLRVPEDVSIMANEDGVLCEFATPTVTAICRDKKMLCDMAFRIMMDRLANPDIPLQTILVPDVLVERESVYQK